MNFRKDINGLRAVAVLGVLFFHFLGDALPGGFAGVDVFFVISGFLMTSIIVSGVEKQRFGLFNFYKARAKRIIPALTVLCFFLLIMGWFYLLPADYKTLAAHVKHSLLFDSNIRFLKESGYFDEASLEKWLLHTWSLSVEWQFYLLYPLVLFLLTKTFSLRVVRPFIVIATTISLMWCIHITTHSPSTAFYLLPTRAWEMLLGALAFLFPVQFSIAQKCWLQRGGLLLIFLSYFVFSNLTPWPGYFSLLPVLGAFLVIFAQREQAGLLENDLLQWFGRISYSLYLWHWPFVVSLNYLGKSSDPLFVVSAILLSIVMGTLSYQLIEKTKSTQTRQGGWIHVAAYLLVLLTTLVVQDKNGFDTRMSAEFKQLTADHVMPRRENGYCFYDFDIRRSTALPISNSGLHCLLGDRSKQADVLLFGDSFAGQYEPFWDEIGKITGSAINSVSTNWCFPSTKDVFAGLTASPAFEQCKLNRQFLRDNMHNYQVVIFAGAWGDIKRFGQLNDALDMIQMASKQVDKVIVMPSPVQYDTNVLKRAHRSYFYGSGFDIKNYSQTRDDNARQAHDAIRKNVAALENVLFIERDQLFPASGTYEKHGHTLPFSLDGMHITLEASLELAHLFEQTTLFKDGLRILFSRTGPYASERTRLPANLVQGSDSTGLEQQ